MPMKNHKDWLQTAYISLSIFLLISFYLYIRRGGYTLSISNKALGNASAILAGLTLILGPLARVSDRFDKYVVLRKPLGLTALFFALLHAVISLFLLPQRFTIAGYIKNPLAPGLGLIAIFIWIYLVKISNTKTIKSFGSSTWKTRQNIFGRLAFIVVFLHLVVLKYPSWIEWLKGQMDATPNLVNPQFPPANFIVFLFMLGILIYRKFFLR